MLRLLRPIIIFIIIVLFFYWANNKFQRISTNSAIKNNATTQSWDINHQDSWLGFTKLVNFVNNIKLSNISWTIIDNINPMQSNNINWLAKLWVDTIFESFQNLTIYNSGQVDILSWENINSNSSCTLWSQVIHNWDYTVAYLYKYSSECRYEKRYCNKWYLSGSYQFTTCIYGDQNVAITNPAVDPKSENTSNINTSNTSTGSSSSNTNPGKNFVDDYEQVQLYINESIDNYIKNNSNTNVNANTNIHNWQIQTTNYSQSLANFNLTKILNDRKQKTDSVTYDNRILNPQLSLEQYVNIMSNLWKHESSQWNTINSQPTITNNPGSTANSKKSCTTPRWSKINHWQSIVAYQNAATAFPNICEFETRYCNDGKLDWTYQFQNCEFGQLTYDTKIDNSSYYIYSDNANIYYPQYLGRQLWNGFYLLSSYNNISSQSPKQWCWINNTYILDWESKTFYNSTLVPWRQYCSWQTRKCTNGIVSWDPSYNHVYCQQDEPKSCRAPWYNIYIPHASSKAYFRDISSCLVEYRYCENWTLWWTYTGTTSNCK